MEILDVHYTANGAIQANIDGAFCLIYDDPANPERQVIAEWEANGNKIAAYAKPVTNLHEYAAQKRWELETGGIDWNGLPVATDRESQNKFTTEVLAIARNERSDGDGWKFADGEFRPLSNAELEELALAVRDHVRNSYAKEAQAVAGIDAGTIKDTGAIDALFLVAGLL